MDTNDLSRETHTAIIDTAESFHHDLILQFGILADDCDTDNEFLNESEKIIKQWLTDLNLDEVIMEIFYDDLPNKKDFKKILIRENWRSFSKQSIGTENNINKGSR